jgi:ribosomal protein L12E/L44/L45/RPP1/RPP2
LFIYEIIKTITESISVKIPEKKIKELLKKLNEVAFFLKSNFETIAIIMW